MIRHTASIHGVPRSGTSWLGQILNSSPDVVFRFQPLFSYQHKGALDENSSGESIQRFFDDILHTDDAFVLMRDPKIHVGYPDPVKNENPTHLIFKSVRYHHILPNLLEKIPDHKVVAIIRDPRGVIDSWCRAPREFDSEWNLDEEWRHASKKNLGRREEYFGYKKWKEATTLFMTLKKRYPERVLVIRYLDLHESTSETITEILGHIQLSHSHAIDEFIQHSKGSLIDDPNSVLRAGHRHDAWRNSLPRDISDAIETDLKGTELEVFIS
jgi:hypothetical protein